MYTVKMYKVKIAALKIWCQFKLKKKKLAKGQRVLLFEKNKEEIEELLKAKISNFLIEIDNY